MNEPQGVRRQARRRLNFGSAGVGSGSHILCEMLNLALGRAVTCTCPIAAPGPVAGPDRRPRRLLCTPSRRRARPRQGTVKGIAVMAEKRVPIIADLATTGEQGLPGVEAAVWNAFFLPKGTPEPIVRKLNKAMSDAIDDPAIRRRLEELGLEIVPPSAARPNISPSFCRRRSSAGRSRSGRPGSARIERVRSVVSRIRPTRPSVNSPTVQSRFAVIKRTSADPAPATLGEREVIE